MSQPYISDPKLVPRIKLFLENRMDESVIDPDDVVQHLQATYSDYSRKKKKAFELLVAKALSLAQTEMYGWAVDKKSRDDSSSDSGPEGLVSYENKNLMNLAMRNLYKGTASDKTPDSPQDGEGTPKKKKKKKKPHLTGKDETKDGALGGVLIPNIAFEDRTPQRLGVGGRSCVCKCTCGARQVSNDGATPVHLKRVESGRMSPAVFNNSADDSSRRLLKDMFVEVEKHFSKANGADGSSDGSIKFSKELYAELKGYLATAPGKSISSVTSTTPSQKGDIGEKRKRKGPLKETTEQPEEPTDESTGKKKSKRKKTKLEDDILDDEPVIPMQTLDDFVGNEKLIEELKSKLEELNDAAYCRFMGLRSVHGYLFHGPEGSGKKFLGECIAGYLKLPLLKPRTTKLISGVSGDSEQRIRELFEEAMSQAPCVLYLDDIDTLAPRQEAFGTSKEMTNRIVSELGACIDKLGKQPENVLLLGATRKIDCVNEALRIPGRFVEKTLGIPGEAARQSLLSKMCSAIPVSDDCSMKTLARLTPGFVAGDLHDLVQNALSRGCSRVRSLYKTPEMLRYCYTPPVHLSGQGVEISLTEQDKEAQTLTEEDFMAALTVAQPAALREGFATVPTTTWSDIGALQYVREQLEDSILLCIRKPEKAARFKIPTNFGVMLVGPPGCGKTLVAKAMANEAGLNFMHIKGPELLNKYVGESERNVRSIFDKAQMCAPCLIFFDEMDALCSNRQSSEGGGVSKSVTNQLLALMDGCGERKQVYIMGATNIIESIDPAMLRPGRFDRKIFIGLQDIDGRLDILRALTKDCDKRKFVSCDLQYLAEETEGLSGADLKKLRDEAVLIAFKEASDDESETLVTGEHFMRALPQVKPSVMKKAAEKYQRVARQCDSQ